MNKKQIVVGVAIVAIMGYLYSLPVKGLIKAGAARDKAQSAPPQAMAAKAASNVTVEMVSEPAKTAIGAGLSAKITDLEGQLKNASGDAEKLSIDKKLAASWDDVNQPAPAAFYYQAVARKDNSYTAWLNSGNRFNDALKITQDTALTPAYITGAVEAFTNALKLKPQSLEAKTGLGVAYVNGGASPMQGIALLREVVAQDPNNISANLNLGLFSMKSGQFNKAVQRFKTVIAHNPGFEPYFYLAETYKQLGQKPEAIAAYQKCKEMMPDPAFGQRIDQYIKELKN
ncbi:tetratricopeptide repeat protein [Mucilaginibacter corticis]|uniref:Tetratricopeptide repeat protein n=1 Tax=Mucilaginibacter corticis TaxID=2597670 RepID=A0A556MUS4_9SPHI|nr:tetratricopeptide repeat protein [Mucilaginibacter corticis]TSJ43602.1 tetratricopeptide repeat protein [Mucilaginibacter corticis]